MKFFYFSTREKNPKTYIHSENGITLVKEYKEPWKGRCFPDLISGPVHPTTFHLGIGIPVLPGDEVIMGCACYNCPDIYLTEIKDLEAIGKLDEISAHCADKKDIKIFSKKDKKWLEELISAMPNLPKSNLLSDEFFD
jgi:hypothetical protein